MSIEAAMLLCRECKRPCRDGVLCETCDTHLGELHSLRSVRTALEEAVYVRIGQVGALRGYSGQLRRAVQTALNSLMLGDTAYALKLLRDALEVPNPDTQKPEEL